MTRTTALMLMSMMRTRMLMLMMMMMMMMMIIAMKIEHVCKTSNKAQAISPIPPSFSRFPKETCRNRSVYRTIHAAKRNSHHSKGPKGDAAQSISRLWYSIVRSHSSSSSLLLQNSSSSTSASFPLLNA